MSLILLNLVTPEEELRLATADFEFEESWPQQVVCGWPYGEFAASLLRYEKAKLRLGRAREVMTELKAASQ